MSEKIPFSIENQKLMCPQHFRVGIARMKLEINKKYIMTGSREEIIWKEVKKRTNRGPGGLAY